MSQQKRKVSEPILPEIEQCPNCGHTVLLGDTRCSNCNYDLQSTRQKLREQPAIVVSVFLFGFGVMAALAATGTDGVLQLALFVVGMGFIVSGGLYYAFDLLVLNADDKRQHPTDDT